MSIEPYTDNDYTRYTRDGAKAAATRQNREEDIKNKAALIDFSPGPEKSELDMAEEVIVENQHTVKALLEVLEDRRGKIEELEAWQNVAAESNRDMIAFLRERFSEWPDNFEEGMPTFYVRKVVEYLDNYNESLRQNLQMWHDRARSKKSAQCLGKVLEKLSGDLNYNNIAAAKEILKELLKGE